MKAYLRTLCIAVTLIISAGSLTAVEVNSLSPDLYYSDEWYCPQEQGKYQVEVLVRAKVSYPYDLCGQIINNRRNDERVIISLGEYVRLNILSSQEISAGSRFKEEVVYVSE
jgi:hypothetical protein